MNLLLLVVGAVLAMEEAPGEYYLKTVEPPEKESLAALLQSLEQSARAVAPLVRVDQQQWCRGLLQQEQQRQQQLQRPFDGGLDVVIQMLSQQRELLEQTMKANNEQQELLKQCTFQLNLSMSWLFQNIWAKFPEFASSHESLLERLLTTNAVTDPMALQKYMNAANEAGHQQVPREEETVCTSPASQPYVEHSYPNVPLTDNGMFDGSKQYVVIVTSVQNHNGDILNGLKAVKFFAQKHNYCTYWLRDHQGQMESQEDATKKEKFVMGHSALPAHVKHVVSYSAYTDDVPFKLKDDKIKQLFQNAKWIIGASALELSGSGGYNSPKQTGEVLKIIATMNDNGWLRGKTYSFDEYAEHGRIIRLNGTPRDVEIVPAGITANDKPAYVWTSFVGDWPVGETVGENWKQNIFNFIQHDVEVNEQLNLGEFTTDKIRLWWHYTKPRKAENLRKDGNSGLPIWETPSSYHTNRVEDLIGYMDNDNDYLDIVVSPKASDDIDSKVFLYTKESGKRILIVNARIPMVQMRYFLEQVEPFVMITGDQSLVEAIVMGKVIVETDNKDELYYAFLEKMKRLLGMADAGGVTQDLKKWMSAPAIDFHWRRLTPPNFPRPFMQVWATLSTDERRRAGVKLLSSLEAYFERELGLSGL